MRINRKKRKWQVWQAISSIADNKSRATHTFLALSVDGQLSVESFKQIIDYTGEKIILSAGGKTLYLYGKGLQVVSYNKYDINISGSLEKIEIFEVK